MWEIEVISQRFNLLASIHKQVPNISLRKIKCEISVASLKF